LLRDAAVGGRVADGAARTVLVRHTLDTSAGERLAVGGGRVAVRVGLTGDAHPQPPADRAGDRAAAAGLRQVVSALDAEPGVVVGFAVRGGGGTGRAGPLRIAQRDTMVGSAGPPLTAIVVRPALDAAMGGGVASHAPDAQGGAVVVAQALDAGGGRGIAVPGRQPALRVLIASPLVEGHVLVTGCQR